MADEFYEDPDASVCAEDMSTGQMSLFPMHVWAKEMSLQDYLDLRGWQGAPEDPRQANGYLVERGDLVSNQEGFQGFIYWVPEAEFREKYQHISNITLH